MFGVAVKVLHFGTWLGIAAYFLLGREFRDEELGILLWPFAGLYLLSVFYVLSFIVFRSMQSWLRYIAIPLWCTTMILMFASVAALAFTKQCNISDGDRAGKPSQPDAAETNRASSRPATGH
ncbi:hypothetical protein BAC2_00179 [uncultured bacterium]|nr:hypothetical protein BAC2_00179 [uncultured bacterium]